MHVLMNSISLIITLLSPAHSSAPVGSKVIQLTPPAVLLEPPFTAMPVDTLNNFTWALLLPSYTHIQSRNIALI